LFSQEFVPSSVYGTLLDGALMPVVAGGIQVLTFYGKLTEVLLLLEF